MLNMFRAVCRSSSGAPTVLAASGLHTHVVTARSQVWVGTGLVVTNTFGAPDDERHTARNMLSI